MVGESLPGACSPAPGFLHLLLSSLYSVSLHLFPGEKIVTQTTEALLQLCSSLSQVGPILRLPMSLNLHSSQAASRGKSLGPPPFLSFPPQLPPALSSLQLSALLSFPPSAHSIPGYQKAFHPTCFPFYRWQN